MHAHRPWRLQLHGCTCHTAFGSCHPRDAIIGMIASFESHLLVDSIAALVCEQRAQSHVLAYPSQAPYHAACMAVGWPSALHPC